MLITGLHDVLITGSPCSVLISHHRLATHCSSPAHSALITGPTVLCSQEYGLYVAAMIDGDSRMCLALTALTNKLPYTLYSSVFLPFANTWGLPDQLITDQGPEFMLIAFVCLLVQRIAQFGNTRKAHKCTKSTSNVSVCSYLQLPSPSLQP